MKTKNCPFCSKEISDEAIICKYCHRLLIDENGNDILPEEEEFDEAEEIAEEEPAVDEEKTIIYNKEDLQNLMNKKNSAQEPSAPEIVDEDIPDDEDDGEEEFDASAVIGGDLDSYPDDEYGDDTDDGGYEDEDYADEQPVFGRNNNKSSEYDDEDLADAADYDPKRTFMITAIVTLGILLIIIVAVLVGYKLFGFGNDEDTTTSQAALTTAAPAETTAPDTTSLAAPADDSATFVPQITDDTVSENPEEIVNSSLSDPVDSNATVVPAPVVDSEASTPETVVPDNNSTTDSVSNIVIIPDPDAVSSQASTDSSTDSSADSATDSIGDGPAADSSNTEPAGEGAPGFDAAGSYYSWGEAEQLMATYASNNGISNYSYYGGTDGVEMLYAVYDDYGNATVYRVDLQTGYVSAY